MEIGPDYARLMARYAAWQNAALIGAAETLAPDALTLDRGAFFGSIFATLNHLLWGDRIWMARFSGSPMPNRGSIAESVAEEPDWRRFVAARTDRDTMTVSWADGLEPGALNGDLTWHSGALDREVSKPRAMLVVHMFNHGTHHRGQVHAMLTAAGARTADTDLFVMPEIP